MSVFTLLSAYQGPEDGDTLGRGSENLINQLNMRLCMNSWDEMFSNYLHKLAMCIATVSSIRYGCQSYFEVHHKNPNLTLAGLHAQAQETQIS